MGIQTTIQVSRPRCLGAFSLFVALFLFGPFLPSAKAFNQADAQKRAANVNHRGSDDSMEAATTSGMMALMNLASLNIPGAVNNGYRAYGQYLNSEKLDDLEFRTQVRKYKMASAGTFTPGDTGPAEPRQTTFSRLDPGFLHRGKAAEVAEEFERRSGMDRGRFLQHLGSATDSGLSFEDPDLLRKIEGRYAMFKSDIRNPEFLQGLERVENMFPQSAREEMLGKFKGLYAESRASGAASQIASDISPASEQQPGSAQAFAPLTAASSQASEIAAAPAAAPAQTNENRLPASQGHLENRAGMFIGIAEGDSQATINELLGSPDTAENETIFLKVSKRYRKLAPNLLGRANVFSAQ